MISIRAEYYPPWAAVDADGGAGHRVADGEGLVPVGAPAGDVGEAMNPEHGVRVAERHGVARRRRRRREMVRRRDAVGVHALLPVAVLRRGGVLLPAVESKLPLLHGGGAVEGVTGGRARRRAEPGEGEAVEHRRLLGVLLPRRRRRRPEGHERRRRGADLGRRKLPLHRRRRASSSSSIICITRNYKFTHKSRRTAKKNTTIAAQIYLRRIEEKKGAKSRTRKSCRFEQAI